MADRRAGASGERSGCTATAGRCARVSASMIALPLRSRFIRLGRVRSSPQNPECGNGMSDITTITCRLFIEDGVYNQGWNDPDPQLERLLEQVAKGLPKLRVDSETLIDQSH